VSISFTHHQIQYFSLISIAYSQTRSPAGAAPGNLVSMILTLADAPHQLISCSVMPNSGKGSHMARCGAVDPRLRYKMSHRAPSYAAWHARCLYIHKRPIWPEEGSNQGGFAFQILNNSGYRGRHGFPQTRQEAEQLLLHSKQASNRITPLTRGFFCPLKNATRACQHGRRPEGLKPVESHCAIRA
jgi:hypothetical protein